MSKKTALAGGAALAAVLSCLSAGGVIPPTSAQALASVTPSQRVIVVMRDQHAGLLPRAESARRADALDHDQLPLVRALKDSGAKNLHRLSAVNAVAATVSPAERSRLAADPAVASVVPDRWIPAPRRAASAAEAAPRAAAASGLCPADPARPLVEPEALHLTRADAAQRLATGKGVKVAFFSDGIDVANPEFVRPDGSHVISAVRDFTGDGTQDHTDGGEAFGDAGAIAAQGARTYDLATELPHSGLPKGCTFRIRGFAPDADLVALKVWGEHSGGWLSQMARAIDDAVWNVKADVINVSTDYGALPDTAADPLRLAIRAAVAAGVTVVHASGDSGTSGTISAPASDPDAITVGGTNSFRLLAQAYGYPAYTSGDIAALSSGGTTQGGKLVDLVAPAQAGMAPCTVDPHYTGCTSDTLVWGGTSQAGPFVAGAAALVIEAYEHAHGGARPAPGLVKRLLTGTATDLDSPADEQGAGLLDTEAAVRAAQGDGGLVPSVSQVNVTGTGGGVQAATVSLTNTGSQARQVTMTSRAVGAETFRTDRTATVGDPLDTGAPEGALAAAPVTFDVPSGTPLLDAEMVWPGTKDSGTLSLFLVDPEGRLTQMSYDYDGYGNYTDYQHVGVHHPVAGTWTAKVVWNNGRAHLADPPIKPGSYRGPVKLRFTGHAFASAGVPQRTRTIAPGATADFDVQVPLPAEAGDAPASLQFDAADGTHLSVPVARRTLLGDSFTTTVTGGVGRLVGQVTGYDLDVPAGHRDLSVDLAAQDPGTTLAFYLVDPQGQIAASDTNLTGTDGKTPTGVASLTAVSPAAGRWRVLVVLPNPVSGKDFADQVTGHVRYDTVDVTASGLPAEQAHRLARGAKQEVTVRVRNTGPAGRYLFLDPRLATDTDLALTPTGGSATAQLPFPDSATWRVPRHTSVLTAVGTADSPVDLEMAHTTVAPDVVGFARAGNTVTASLSAAGVTPGDWYTELTPAGPFGAAPAPTGTGHVTLTARTKSFDTAVSSTTGDFWQPGSTVTPVFVAAGGSVTLTATVTPSAPVGAVVRGTLYVETYTPASGEKTGSVLAGIPYAYTVG
ncbi:S8 family serine peptidase [Streptomyces roseirectus]|uniref:S8 family serine peptidase n=1 Tax=Streptomyces roseirectus TaxID=2768066 RepID=A0A7H0IRL9_9ACTN|nr:S8 family serine peptidase [Streptomyces roseirectus]QNP75435.1 S8 family serine peptidase [Streptomyces roseirectus]